MTEDNITYEPTDEEKVLITIDSTTSQYYGWIKTSDGEYLYGILTPFQQLEVDVLTLQKQAIDSGHNTFVEPQVPYSVGDLLQLQDGIYIATSSREQGEFDIEDWEIAISYNIPSVLAGNEIDPEGEWAGIEVLTEIIQPVRLWAGTSFEDRYSAPFRVLEDGTIIATKAIITGEINATSGTFKNIIVTGSMRSPFTSHEDFHTLGHTDNMALVSADGGWIDEYYLPWTTDQAGRKVCITNYKWKEEYSSGTAVVPAPTGKYFYENGIALSELILSRECVELLGYGESSNFYGWIVLNRINLMTERRYGKKCLALAQGTITGTSSGATIYCKTCDGSNLTTQRLAVGKYRINFPSNWLQKAEHCLVYVTGYGNIVGGSNPIKASVDTIAINYVDISTSDDASRNDGSFMFVIENLASMGDPQTS